MCPKPTVLAAALHVAALLSFSSANAPGSGVIGGRVCDTFHVHEAHTQSTGMASYNAEIIVKNSSGHRVQCYQPSQQHYTVEIRGIYSIAGFLIKLNRGDLSLLDARDTVYFIQGVCGADSVAHREILSNVQPPNPPIRFRFNAPKSRRGVDFRYTIVFDRWKHIEDQHYQLVACSAPPPPPKPSPTPSPTPTPTPTPPPPPRDCTQTNHETNEVQQQTNDVLGQPINSNAPAEGTCGKTITSEHKIVYEDRNGIRYKCTSNRPIRNLTCESSCASEVEGRSLCCKPKNTYERRKGFTCVPEDINSTALQNTKTYTKTVILKISNGGCECQDCCNQSS